MSISEFNGNLNTFDYPMSDRIRLDSLIEQEKNKSSTDDDLENTQAVSFPTKPLELSQTIERMAQFSGQATETIERMAQLSEQATETIERMAQLSKQAAKTIERTIQRLEQKAQTLERASIESWYKRAYNYICKLFANLFLWIKNFVNIRTD